MKFWVFLFFSPWLTQATEIPRIHFALDRKMICDTKTSDPTAFSLLKAIHGIEIVKNEGALAVPGKKIKLLPTDGKSCAGVFQMPQAVWQEAESALSVFQKHWDTPGRTSRGEELMRRTVQATGIKFPFQEMTIKLYLCPDFLKAYDMQGFPFFQYLKSVYPQQSLRWTVRDFVDWYMYHEVLHWYLLYQPWLRIWTPQLQKYHQWATLVDPNYGNGKLIFPAKGEYPDLHLNQVNFLGHLHLNAIRKVAFAREPLLWEYIKAREKGFTDAYYGGSIDVLDYASPAELAAFLKEIADNPAPNVK